MPALAPCPDRTHPTYHDDVNIDAWVWWLIGAAGLGIPLVLTALPEFGMFAVGALAAAGTAALGGERWPRSWSSSSCRSR